MPSDKAVLDPMKRHNPFIVTTWWVILAAALCILRPSGSLKPGIIMFALTPFPLVFDIVRRKFSATLNKPAARKPGGG
jgi:hypothetical protein